MTSFLLHPVHGLLKTDCLSGCILLSATDFFTDIHFQANANYNATCLACFKGMCSISLNWNAKGNPKWSVRGNANGTPMERKLER